MAYRNLLASVSEMDMARLRHDPAFLVRPSMVSGVSHLLSYWVEAQPLGGLLYRALDGGQPIHPALRHPFRPPLYLAPADVGELVHAIDTAWNRLVGTEALPDEEWLTFEVNRLLRIFRHAATAGECIVSRLDAPVDADRSGGGRSIWTSQGSG